jgi:dTMP kinase
VRAGRFITFEGGEGTGKSTQVRRLAGRLHEAGQEVVLSREPGGSPGAEEIRRLLVTGEADRWTSTAETLLLYAARSDHLDRVIRPALERGAWVLCDRFADSTRAYQGAAGGVSPGLLSALEHEVLDGDSPDLTLVLDLPAAAGLERASGRGGSENRFESKAGGFHDRLREAFLEIAVAEPERCVVIDAAAEEDEVARAVWSVVRERLQP